MAGKCCFSGLSCTACPHGSAPDNHGCAGKGNYRCIRQGDCWSQCGWDGYCMGCEDPGKGEDRACCRQGVSSPVCGLVNASLTKPDYHTCVNVPLVSDKSWVTRFVFTAFEETVQNVPMLGGWTSINVGYGPGTLSKLSLDRVRISVDQPYITINITGLGFRVDASGWFRLGSGSISVEAPAGDLLVRLKLPSSHHIKSGQPLDLQLEEFWDTWDLKVDVQIGWFPSAALGPFVNFVKQKVQEALPSTINRFMGGMFTWAVKLLDKQQHRREKKVPGITSAGDCCAVGSRCHMCPFGYAHDRHLCAGKGDLRCLEEPLTQKIGQCCALGSSCNSCPHGAFADGSCAHAGSFRCRSIPDCLSKCGSQSGWCMQCSRGSACCASNSNHTDPPECEAASVQYPEEGHQCSVVSGDQPFLESLRFPIPDQCIKSGPISITLAKFHVGSVDLRRLRVDMLQDQFAISFENPEADITGSYSIL